MRTKILTIAVCLMITGCARPQGGAEAGVSATIPVTSSDDVDEREREKTDRHVQRMTESRQMSIDQDKMQ